MILKFSFAYASSSLVYEKVTLRLLESFSLNGKLLREANELRLYVEAEDTDALEAFANRLGESLPHSIFLDTTEVIVVDEMPTESYDLTQTSKLEMPFCPQCLSEVMDKTNENYYNIFHECDACGYGLVGEKKSYKEVIERAANSIKNGSVLEVDTFYGRYYLGQINKNCKDVDFDILSYDLATVEKYANVTNSEIVTLGAIEKPLIRLKTNLDFKKEFEDIEKELLRFKLADDLLLHFLMHELHILGIDLVFMTQSKISEDDTLSLVEYKESLEPIECVVSDERVAILSGEKGLPFKNLQNEVAIPHIGAFFSVIKEHDLLDKTVIGVNLSKEYHNDILVYAKKFGTVEYLSFAFEYNSMKEVFDAISATNETGEKLINNYKKKYAEHFDEISQIIFNEKIFNVHKLWGIVSIVLGFTKSSNLTEAGEILENSATSFLGTKGPRIDYKLISVDSKVFLDPLMTIRTAMSFRLAEVDQLTLSYGVVESFVEFISNQLDDIKVEMKSDSVAVTGSLLGNRHLFSKLNTEVSINHEICFNKELPVDGRNIQYGGNELF